MLLLHAVVGLCFPAITAVLSLRSAFTIRGCLSFCFSPLVVVLFFLLLRVEILFPLPSGLFVQHLLQINSGLVWPAVAGPRSISVSDRWSPLPEFGDFDSSHEPKFTNSKPNTFNPIARSPRHYAPVICVLCIVSVTIDCYFMTCVINAYNV